MHVSEAQWDSVLNGMWVTYAILTTVGYGDMFPMTYLGRIVAVIASILGNYFVSLFILALTASSEFTPEEYRAY